MQKTYFIQTLGCQQNQSDSERVASVFEKIGYKKAETEQEASVMVVNSCAIRQTSMDRVYGKLRHWRPRQEAGELTTILTGCVLKHDRDRLAKEFDYIVDLEDIPKIPEVLGEGEALDLDHYFSVAPEHENDFKAYIPIMTGCDKFCTYCAVPYTRGREISRPAQDILDEAKALIEKGYKEISLLGQNVNSYAGQLETSQDKRGLLVLGRKAKAANEEAPEFIDFPELLKRVAEIPGDFWVRYVTSHPYDMSDKLIETMAAHEKIANQVNLPVQSGDDGVLKRMNRHYTVEHYKERLAKCRELIPDIALCTDIIIGFAGETEEEHKNTLKLMEEMEYDLAYLNKYSPRPGTSAEKKYEDSVPWEVKKKREKEINEILKKTALEKNQKYLGKTVRVLVDAAEMRHGASVTTNSGKTEHYKKVRFDAGRDYMGQFVEVKITHVEAFGMQGELV